MTQKRTPLSLCGVSVGADLRPDDIIEAALADVRFAGHLLVGQLDAVAGVVMGDHVEDCFA